MFLCKLFSMAEDDLSNSFNSNQKDGESDTEPSLPLRLDLGDDSSRSADLNRLGNQNTAGSGSNSSTNDGYKREDNPFSFKHFLRSDSSSSYQNKGARPKVYKENSLPTSDFGNNHAPEPIQSSRVVPELSSALPDFVQDHLVIEQCYLGNSNNSNYNLNVDLPDFAPSRNINGRVNSNNTNKPIPLDLPIRPQGAFPLDLPIASSPSSSTRSCSNVSEVGNSKSLPDFLADSAVCTQKGDTSSVPRSPESELERLRHELDITRRQFNEQSRLCECLSRELELARNKEHEYTQNLAKALEQVENNLEKSNKRAASAENVAIKLKQEVKSLTAQISQLKLENQSLRGDEAAGGHGYYNNSSNEWHSHRLALELRAAANTAEYSLRQLLAGVDNLRIMAGTVENMHRIDEKSDKFPDFDEGAGPAL